MIVLNVNIANDLDLAIIRKDEQLYITSEEISKKFNIKMMSVRSAIRRLQVKKYSGIFNKEELVKNKIQSGRGHLVAIYKLYDVLPYITYCIKNRYDYKIAMIESNKLIMLCGEYEIAEEELENLITFEKISDMDNFRKGNGGLLYK